MMARALGLLAVTSVYAFTHDESAACYASRYPELRARFCATDRCDTHALHDHYKNVGATEGRRWGCGSRFDAVSDLARIRCGRECAKVTTDLAVGVVDDRRWCILQFDTRANETYFPEYAKASSKLWRKYAHDHNATYRLVAPKPPPFRRPTWSKWETIADYYAVCDIITVADVDTYIRRPEIHLLE